MDFSSIIVALIYAGCINTFIILLFRYLNKMEERKDREIENEKMNLYSTLDINAIDKTIDEIIKKYINKYIIQNVLINGETYIKKDVIEEMVRDITKQFIVDISDLHLFYIKMLTNINTENDLLEFIYKKVCDRTLEIVTEYNKPER